MQLHRPTKRDQSGFSAIEVLLVVLVIAVLAVAGFVVYQHRKPSSVKNSAATSQTQTTTTPAQTTTQYLDIKEWGVRLTLDSITASMYYYIKPGLPNVAYISLKTISDIAPDCAADKVSLGAVARLTDAQQKAATANPSDLNQPGTVHIGNYWYDAQNSHAACFDSSEDVAIQKALPGYNIGEIDKALNTLAADPSTN